MPRKNASILIVEDNPDHAELIEATIRDCEPAIQIHNQKNGEDALQFLATSAALKNTLPDLIFMDIKMPRMNGIETLIALKQDTNLRQIPVVMLSTSTNESEMHICMKSGAEIYLAKPLQAITFELQILPLIKHWNDTINRKSASKSL